MGLKLTIKVLTRKIPCRLHHGHWGRLRLSIILAMVRIPAAPFLFRLQLFQPSATSRLLRAAGMLQAIQGKIYDFCNRNTDSRGKVIVIFRIFAAFLQFV